jgi:hypothetical protein
MKTKIGFLSVVLLPLLGLLFPQLVNIEDGTYFANIVGLAGLVAIIVEGLKKLLKYGELYGNKISWRYLPQVLALSTGVLCSFIGDYFAFGMFNGLELLWWQVVGTGVIAGGLSMAWYDAKFAQFGLQFIWSLKVRDTKNE